MPDFNIRSDSVDVEQIMEQIRARVREKRGVDYTEQQIRELAAVKLEKFLDPRGVRSDLLDRFRKVQSEHEPPPPPNYAFGEDTLYETHRGAIRWIRRLLQPILKLFFNPNPLIQALNIQSRLNTLNAERESARRGLDQLHFEVIHNLVIEATRLGIEVKNLKMLVESLTSRLEFNERRARALEGVVVYKAADERSPQRTAAPPGDTAHSGMDQEGPGRGDLTTDRDGGLAAAAPPSPASPGEGPGQRSRRRRRRRGRRGGGQIGPGVDGGHEARPSSMVTKSDPGPQSAPVDVEESETGSKPQADERPEQGDSTLSNHSTGSGTGSPEPDQT